MTNFIPVFPLKVAIKPGEGLHLHISQNKYKQLVGECYAGKKPFGILSVVDGKLSEMGTLVEIVSITKWYNNDILEVKTHGIKAFRVLEIIKEIPDKLYSGAIVYYYSQ